MAVRLFRVTILLIAVLLQGAIGLPDRCFGQVLVEEPPTATASATPRQKQWLNATPQERVSLAEQLGETGARQYARQKGWSPIMDGRGKTIPQGLDQVYRSADGTIHVVEAKGGTSALGHAYGHPQGTPEWAVRSAERILRSSKTTAAEKQAARAVLDAATKGKLQVHVVRTPHVLGEPTAAVCEQTLATSDEAARLAAEVLGRPPRMLPSAPTSSTESVGKQVGRLADEGAAAIKSASQGAARAGSRLLREGGRILVPLGVAVDGGFRICDSVQVEERYRAGQITEEQRELEHAQNAAGMAGGWGGAWAGGVLAAEAAAPVATVTGPAGPWVEGGAVLVGGVVGYIGGEKLAEEAAGAAVRAIHSTGTTIAEQTTKAARYVRKTVESWGRGIFRAWQRVW